jgi:calcineurin-like phosphoesterase family protein
MRHSINWLITDTHFFHKNIINFCGRPQDFTEKIIKNLKYYVKPQDNIIHLGDVIFGEEKQLKGIMDSIPGKKILVRGNHDKHTYSWYQNNGFDFVCDLLVLHKVALSHKPIRLPDGCDYNIHGHFHNISEDKWEPSLKELLTKQHYLLKLEHHYKPIDLMQIRNALRSNDT